MERLTSEQLQIQGPSRLEHRHRYLCAASISRGAVLDLACGIGYGANILLANPDVENYVGVDVERVAIEQALVEPPAKAHFLVASACHLPFGEEAFDTIVSLETLEHLGNPVCALAEFRRVLRSDGVLVGSVPTAAFKSFCTAQYGPNQLHLHAFSAEQIKTLLKQAFPFVEIFVARVSLAAGIFDVVGERGPFYHEICAETPSNGSSYGSYVFVASQRRLWDNLAQRLGVLSIGGSYFEAERLQIDRLLAARLMDDLVAQTLSEKDLYILQRGAEIDRLASLLATKNEFIQQRDERILQAKALIAAKNAHLGVAESELDATRAELDATRTELNATRAELDATRTQFHDTWTELARMKGSRGWRVFCRLRNLVRFGQVS